MCNKDKRMQHIDLIHVNYIQSVILGFSLQQHGFVPSPHFSVEANILTLYL